MNDVIHIKAPEKDWEQLASLLRAVEQDPDGAIIITSSDVEIKVIKPLINLFGLKGSFEKYGNKLVFLTESFDVTCDYSDDPLYLLVEKDATGIRVVTVKNKNQNILVDLSKVAKVAKIPSKDDPRLGLDLQA